MKKKSVASHKNIFISSVQKELQQERRALKEFIQGDALLRRYFDVFLFEDLPASDRKADDVYLEEVGQCDVYVGLFGNEYGLEDARGLSPTEREFDLATANGKPRLIFVKGMGDKSRHPKMLSLIRKAGAQLIRRRFTDVPDLTAALYAALVERLEHSGDLRSLPFDASDCPRATLNDLPQEKIDQFLETAKRERNYALPARTSREKALSHLNLLNDSRPTHAAILLFGKNPQRFLPSSELKCMHFHSVKVSKPIPSYQIFQGTVGFFVTTLWRDWLSDEVMAKLDLSDRQKLAVAIIKAQGRITNREYREQTGVIIRTASRDLEGLVDKGVLKKVGTTGRNIFYVLSGKLDIK